MDSSLLVLCIFVDCKVLYLCHFFLVNIALYEFYMLVFFRHSFVLGDALAVNTQYFRPSPKRLWTPKDSKVFGQRLCTDKFFGCSLCRWLVLYLVII